jgi:hypothetical protein
LVLRDFYRRAVIAGFGSWSKMGSLCFFVD